MSTELLEVQPQELKFLFELKKQSSCSVRLVNKTNHHVAFKVKTTSPKKYCVRPNTGIMKPKSTRDFVVTMQAQKVIPPDMICKDKFLLQAAIVQVGTAEEEITSATFAKDGGKYIEEKKLRVILVSPPTSPILSPINGTLKQVPPAYEDSALKAQHLNSIENLSPRQTVVENVMKTKIRNAEELEPMKDESAEELGPAKDDNTEELKPVKEETAEGLKLTKELKLTKDENSEELERAKYVEGITINEVESRIMKDEEELKLVKDIEEMKSKLKEFELKLSEAEVTISKLTEEKRMSSQDRELLQQELGLMRSKMRVRRVQAGFPLLYVCMVSLVSVLLGFLLHRP